MNSNKSEKPFIYVSLNLILIKNTPLKNNTSNSINYFLDVTLSWLALWRFIGLIFLSRIFISWSEILKEKYILFVSYSMKFMWAKMGLLKRKSIWMFKIICNNSMEISWNLWKKYYKQKKDKNNSRDNRLSYEGKKKTY